MKIFKAVHVHGGDLIDEVFARIGAENFNLGWQDFVNLMAFRSKTMLVYIL